MLTPEEKQRIEDEERKRIAEEQYRAEVRTKLQPARAHLAQFPNVALSLVLVLVLLVAGILVLGRGAKRSSDMPASLEAPLRPVSTQSTPSIRYVPATQQIASGQVVVPARGYVQYRIDVQPTMREARVSGSFSASGGGGNDVDAALATEGEFINWINGHQARVLYGTMGKRTIDSFDVRLSPGTYVFAINNKFSAFASKNVFLDVKLNYQRMETY